MPVGTYFASFDGFSKESCYIAPTNRFQAGVLRKDFFA